MTQSKNDNEIFQKVFYIFVYIFIIFVIIFVVKEVINNNKVNINRYIKSIGISGYELDKPFSENEYYYTIVVNKDEVEVVCDTDYETRDVEKLLI